MVRKKRGVTLTDGELIMADDQRGAIDQSLGALVVEVATLRTNLVHLHDRFDRYEREHSIIFDRMGSRLESNDRTLRSDMNNELKEIRNELRPLSLGMAQSRGSFAVLVTIALAFMGIVVGLISGALQSLWKN